MSGHSKWSTIKHKKGIADKRRGQVFSKLSRAITIAAREGGDSETNFKLRLAIDKARQANVPKQNIERAIKKGSGAGEGERLEVAVYEGFGPNQAAVIIEAITDNKNRTTAEIKYLFERGGGSLARPGAVSYLFEKLGLILIKKPIDSQEAILTIMDLGVKNVEQLGEMIEIYVQSELLDQTAQQLIKAGYEIQEKDLVMSPKTAITVGDSKEKEKLFKFLNNIEDHDDVQKVFTNHDFVD